MHHLAAKMGNYWSSADPLSHYNMVNLFNTPTDERSVINGNFRLIVADIFVRYEVIRNENLTSFSFQFC